VAKKFLIRTFGCQMNEHDSERLAGMLVADGMEPTDELESADVVVLNTCCIRENADNKLYGTLGHLATTKAENPGMQIAVTGCLSQKDRGGVLERAGWVDVVVGTHNLGSTAGLLRKAVTDGPQVEILDAPDPQGDLDPTLALNAVRDAAHTAWMTIQTGCDNSCAYCIVPAVRGGEVSRPLDDLVREAEMLARRGVREVTLLGQNVNSYGRDITKRSPLFAELLRSVGAVDGIDRVRFTSPHPKDLRADTVAAMAEVDAVCNQLHLPLQAGSNRVLSAMHRGYTAERYLEKLAMAREAVPDLGVTTDIIVGFPGETEEDFERTLEVAAEAEFDSAFTFIFSPRPGTTAAEMTDQFVDPDVISDRFMRLDAVVQRSGLIKHEARVGMLERVLVEGPSRRNDQVAAARTTQGKLVHYKPLDAHAMKAGALVDVTIVHGAPHHLDAEQLCLVEPTRVRRRLEVRS
jgi:tRNA-2-methylthio-N6-dimethylallyladenosine synthase